MTPSGIEPATFGFVAQRVNHCATAVPTDVVVNNTFIPVYTVEVYLGNTRIDPLVYNIDTS